jgi:hypothetical protein
VAGARGRGEDALHMNRVNNVCLKSTRLRRFEVSDLAASANPLQLLGRSWARRRPTTTLNPYL